MITNVIGFKNTPAKFPSIRVYALRRLDSHICPSTRPRTSAAELYFSFENKYPMIPATAIRITSLVLLFVAYAPIVARIMITGPRIEYGTERIFANTFAIPIDTMTIIILVTNIDANTDERYSGFCLIRSGPTCTPCITSAVIMIAAALPPGIPRERSGTIAPPVALLLAASDATIPSGTPFPRSSGCFETFFSIAYARKDAIVAPAPGRIPTIVPRTDARIITHFFSHSSLIEGSFTEVSSLLVVGSLSTSTFFCLFVCLKTCVTAKRPIITGIISIPESSVEFPNVKRRIPSIGSIPTHARNKPIHPEIRVFIILSLSRNERTERPSNDIAKSSEGPNLRATAASCGDIRAMARAAVIPPNADAISEYPRALPASPFLAIR